MKKIVREIEMILHCNMTLIGGFLGVYAILLRGKNFASAQTANIINMTIGVLDGNVKEIIIRSLAVLIFIGAMSAAILIPKYVKTDIRWICLLVEMFGVLLSGLIPGSIHDMVAIYPIIALTAFQWGVFGSAKGYHSSTIFITNNVKQGLQAFWDYQHTQKSEDAKKMTFFAATIVSYMVGVISGYFSVMKWGAFSIWMCLLPLLVGMSLLVLESRNQQEAEFGEHHQKGLATTSRQNLPASESCAS